jgi:hypothetical protein
MSFALKLAFLLLALGAFGAYTGGPDGSAPQTLEDGNPPPPKP